MEQHGIAWQPPVAGTLHLGRTNRWFLGGGKTLANSYFLTAEKMKIELRYEACVELLAVKNGRFEGVVLTGGEQVRGKAVVIAAGGFEANLEWLRRYWGDAVENFCVRGTPFNDGKMLQVLFDLGAKPIGDQKGFHAIAVDARAPKFDGGIVTRLDAIPFGIVVNCLGQRFADEGANIWPKRYASWGRLIAEQPRQSAYCIVDSKTIRSFLPPIYPPAQSSTIGKLAIELGLNPDILTETVLRYNAATQGNSGLRSDRLDGLCTRQLDPPKSNWAVPLDRPPFYGLPLKPGITFTYLGVEIDEEGHIVRTNGGAYENIFAAGEIMAGNILTKGYLAGFGLTIGSVFGRLAGKGASAYAVG
jgi:tricarballylate dehydrogenase